MADNLITTNITANADFTGLRTQLAATTAQLVKLQETTAGTNAKLANQIAVMNKSFAETMRSTGQFSSHFVSLSSDVDKFGKNLDRGRLKLNDYYNAWNGHTKKTSNLIRDLAKQQVSSFHLVLLKIELHIFFFEYLFHLVLIYLFLFYYIFQQRHRSKF